MLGVVLAVVLNGFLPQAGDFRVVVARMDFEDGRARGSDRAIHVDHVQRLATFEPAAHGTHADPRSRTLAQAAPRRTTTPPPKARSGAHTLAGSPPGNLRRPRAGSSGSPAPRWAEPAAPLVGWSTGSCACTRNHPCGASRRAITPTAARSRDGGSAEEPNAAGCGGRGRPRGLRGRAIAPRPPHRRGVDDRPGRSAGRRPHLRAGAAIRIDRTESRSHDETDAATDPGQAIASRPVRRGRAGGRARGRAGGRGLTVRTGRASYRARPQRPTAVGGWVTDGSLAADGESYAGTSANSMVRGGRPVW